MNLRDDAREVLYWKITGNPGRLLVMNLVGILLLVLASVAFLSWATLWQPARVAAPRSLPGTLGVVVAFLLTIVLHELIHGLAIRLFGGKPTYGFIREGLMFFATAGGYAFQRNQYIGVALAPLILGSLSGALLLILPLSGTVAWAIAVGAAVNAAGAVGDLWITAVVLRYPPTAYVVDEKDGMRIFISA